jgi:hypothetical protein
VIMKRNQESVGLSEEENSTKKQKTVQTRKTKETTNIDAPDITTTINTTRVHGIHESDDNSKQSEKTGGTITTTPTRTTTTTTTTSSSVDTNDKTVAKQDIEKFVRCDKLPHRFSGQKWPHKEGWKNINVCSGSAQIFRELSPMKLGPIVYDLSSEGKQGTLTALNLENCWRTCMPCYH